MKKVLSLLLLLGGLSCSVNGGATLDLRDPVCGVTCYGDKCERETLNGRQFYFCSPECKKKFDRNPEAYLQDR